jgi:hypothetical protein
MRIVWSAALFVTLAAGASGCASAPSPIDMTPRFVTGLQRVESLQAYAALRTPVADVVAHVGFSWRATIRDVGPRGARIEAQVTRVVAKLPGAPAFDTDGVIPLGGLLGVTELLFKLMGARFEYLVGPAGEVHVSGWDTALTEAAMKLGCDVPLDGSVPDEGTIADALGRMYAPVPRRAVMVDERWSAARTYHVGTPGRGSRVRSSDQLVYEGWGDLEVPFADDEPEVHGLGVRIESTPAVSSPGEFFLGRIEPQTGTSTGFLVLSPKGTEVLGYWEKEELEVTPRDGLLPSGGGALLGAAVSLLADLEHGWVFFASSPWR